MKASKHVPARKSNERVFLDILIIENMKNGNKVILTKNNCKIIVDKFSGIKLSDFYDTKNVMIETTCERFKKWKQNGHLVSCFR